MQLSQENLDEGAEVVVTEVVAACFQPFKVEGLVVTTEVVEDEVAFWLLSKHEGLVAAVDAAVEMEAVEDLWQQFKHVAGVDVPRAMNISAKFVSVI